MRRQQRGSAFVVTLATLAGLVTLIVGIAASRAAENRGIWNRMQEGRARLMVDAGIQRAIACLESQDLNVATQSDEWYTLGTSGADEFLVGNDGFRLQILDSCSRVNINSAAQNQLKLLPLSDTQIDCLMDWREKDPQPRPQGAKDDFYTSLTTPYYTKQQPFDSVEELMLVKGFTPQTLYSAGGQSATDPSTTQTGAVLDDLLTVDSACADTDPNGNPKTDIRSASPQQLASLGIPAQVITSIENSAGSFQSIGDAMAVGGMTTQAAHIILDYFNVGGATSRTGVINLNTVSPSVLQAVPGLTTDQVGSLLDTQSAGFPTMGAIADVSGMDFATLQKTVNLFCVGSRSFLVRVMGMAGASTIAMEAELVLNDDGTVTVKRCVPKSYWEVRDRWGWDRAATNQIQLGETS